MSDQPAPSLPPGDPSWDGYPPDRNRDAYYWVVGMGTLKVVRWSGLRWTWLRQGRQRQLPPERARLVWALYGECVPPPEALAAVEALRAERNLLAA